VILAPPDANVSLDGSPPKDFGCEVAPADGLTDAERGSKKAPLLVYTCQLSFPIVDPLAESPNNVSPGMQNDGVHRLDADQPVGIIVSGFDSYVSYSYAGGTELKVINVPH
jgi:hypothetical protein